MKTIFPLSVLALAIAALPGSAQTAKPTTSSATPAKAAGSAPATAAKAAAPARSCVKLPTLSPKIPALPAGLSCAKPLYTITVTRNPSATLTDISPMEDPALRDALGIPLPESFTLSYIDTKVGSGALVAPRKWYSIQYTGYLADGTKFDSSFDHPGHAAFTFQQGPQGPKGQRQVVPGMDTGLDGMKVGGKRRLFIPWLLGYPGGTTNIPPKSMLIFDIELVAQNDNDPSPKPPAPPAAAPTPATAPTAATPPASTTPPAPAAAPAAAAPKPATPPAPAAAPTPGAAPAPSTAPATPKP
jgi:peptidylprolyl isomerase